MRIELPVENFVCLLLGLFLVSAEAMNFVISRCPSWWVGLAIGLGLCITGFTKLRFSRHEKD